LLPFAYWSPEDWTKKGEEVSEIVDRRLGWGMTDFGKNKFCECGPAIFTIRNGPVEDLVSGKGKLYCERC
jgi:D-lyxose ketol-isomerase